MNKFYKTALSFILVSIPSLECLHGYNLPLKIYFFYSDSCVECKDLKKNFFPKMIDKYGSEIYLESLEISNISNFKMQTDLEARYNAVPKNPPPTVFIEDVLLDGKKEIEDRFENTVQQLIIKAESGSKPKRADAGEDKRYCPLVKTNTAVEESFNYLGFATIVGAGLLDGINPCAFSTIIILVLYLSFTGYKKFEILKSGLAFSSGVFAAYLLIGVGLLEFAVRIKFIPWLSLSMNLLFAAVAIVLGCLSIYDYFKILRGKLTDISLQLPKIIKSKIKTLIWRKPGGNVQMLSSFAIGALIGILEFPCTGQVYFPIVLAIRELPGLRLHAFASLVLYNFCFILPLLVVFWLVYMGTTSSNKLTVFLEERAGLIKLLTAMLFFALGGVLIFFSFK